MSVRVIKNKVFDGVKTYEVGDVIEGLSENDKSQLVSDGIVEHVYTKPEEIQEISEEINQNSIIAESPKVDEPLVDSIDKEDSTEVEGEEVEAINIDSLALNADDYLKASAPKGKKRKAV